MEGKRSVAIAKTDVLWELIGEAHQDYEQGSLGGSIMYGK